MEEPDRGRLGAGYAYAGWHILMKQPAQRNVAAASHISRSDVYVNQVSVSVIRIFLQLYNYYKNANARTSHCMQKGGLGAG